MSSSKIMITFLGIGWKVRFRIQKQTTRIRNPLSPEEKLACTLRYLATGESYASLQINFAFLSQQFLYLCLRYVRQYTKHWKMSIYACQQQKMRGRNYLRKYMQIGSSLIPLAQWMVNISPFLILQIVDPPFITIRSSIALCCWG